MSYKNYEYKNSQINNTIEIFYLKKSCGFYKSIKKNQAGNNQKWIDL